MHRILAGFVVLGGVLVIGCAEPNPAASSSATGDASTAPAAPIAAPAADPSANAAAQPATATAQSAPAAPAPGSPTPTAVPVPNTAAAPPPSSLVPAAPGVGVKGRSLDKYDSGVQGAIAQPARSLFAVKERVVFEIQIPHALQLYKALHGTAPATHDDFMREIIEANNIALPELPAGQRYVWRADEEELFVEQPASAP